MGELMESQSRRWRADGVLLCVFAAGVWLIIGSSSAAKSEKNAESTELFTKADQRLNFDSPGSAPIRVEQKFSIFTLTGGAVQGTDTSTWAGADRWRETLKIQDYSELDIGDHASVWRISNQSFSTFAAFKARGLVRFRTSSSLLRNAKVDSVREIQVGQRTDKCVALRSAQGDHLRVCFDPMNGDLLSSEKSGNGPEATIKREDFINVGGHWIPRHTREYFDGKLIAQTDITDASVLTSVGSKDFIPPDAAQQTEKCEDPAHAAPIRKPEPSYTPEARDRKVQGTLRLVVEINRQGDAAAIGILKPLDSGLDANAMQTIKNEWKFKPATCGEIPVRSYVEVETTFRLY
jgi:TonB family protein